jgi:hypothetical protein
MSLTTLLNSLQQSSPLAGFLICHTDNTNDVKYYGYQSFQGAWYIMREDTPNGVYTYCFGASGYSAAWAGRAALTYSLPAEG